MGLLDSGGFWQGEGKAKGGDILAGLLAAVGDTLTRNSGGEGFAVQGLLGQRLGAMDEMRKRAEQEAQMQQTMALLQQAYPDLTDAQRMAMATKVGDYADFKPEKPKGLQPVAGPTGVFVWDRDNNKFVTPPGGVPGGTDSGWVDIDENEARRLGGGGTGNGAGGFPFRR